MSYREDDEEGRRHSEKEIAPAFGARGLALSGGICAALSVVCLPLAGDWHIAPFAVLLLGLVLWFLSAAAVTTERSRRGLALSREISWLAALPFPVEGYLETLSAPTIRSVWVLVTVDLPDDLLPLVTDLVSAVDTPGRPTLLTRGEGTLVLRNESPALRRVDLRLWLAALLDRVLVPVHRLHPIARVGIGCERGKEEAEERRVEGAMAKGMRG